MGWALGHHQITTVAVTSVFKRNHVVSLVFLCIAVRLFNMKRESIGCRVTTNKMCIGVLHTQRVLSTTPGISM